MSKANPKLLEVLTSSKGLLTAIELDSMILTFQHVEHSALLPLIPALEILGLLFQIQVQ